MAVKKNIDTQKDESADCVIKIGDAEYELIFTTKAMKEIYAKYGGITELGEILESGGDVGQMISEIAWVVALLANQSVLIHNYLNPQDKRELLTAEAVELLTNPHEFVELRKLIMPAIYNGMKREVEGEDDEKNRQGG